MRGRKPKPRRLRVVDGSKRPAKSAVQAPPDCPDRPNWSHYLPGSKSAQLRKDAQRSWDSTVPALDRLGILATVDETVLIDFCVCRARLWQCERLLAKEGLSVKGERGVQRHPALTAANMYRGQLRFYIAELGLAPSSRGRIEFPAPEDDEGAEAEVFDRKG